MKKLFTLAALALTLMLSAQEAGKDFTYKPLKWTIKTPAGFEKAEVDAEALTEEEVAIFSIINSDEDTMEATIEPYNVGEDGDYGSMQELTASLMKGLLESSFEEAGGEVELTTEKETVGGKEFYHHTFTFGFDGETATMHLFNGLIGDNDFCMSITYSDTAEGEKMLKAFRESKFN
jgi:hypothetical protein